MNDVRPAHAGRTRIGSLTRRRRIRWSRCRFAGVGVEADGRMIAAPGRTGLVWNSFEAHGAPIVCLADFGFRGVRGSDPPLFSRFAIEGSCLVLPSGGFERRGNGMAGRVRRIVAHFPSAFRLAAVDAIQPAGAYAVDLEEEVRPGELHMSSECAGMRIQLAAMLDGRLAIRSVPVTPSELGMAILDETGPGAAKRQSAD